MISTLEPLVRASYIKTLLDPLKDKGIEFEFFSEEGQKVFNGLDPNFHAVVADYIVLYKISPFYRRKKELARVYHREERMRLEVFDENFKKEHATLLQNCLDAYPVFSIAV